MKIISLFLFILLSPVVVLSQQQNYNWCFGDSAGITFNNLSNPTPFQSGMNSRGSCASISDSLGNLLFYASTPYRQNMVNGLSRLAAVFNKQHLLMQNGDTIVGQGWYHEIVTVPKPAIDSIYFVFSVGVTGAHYGCYYSIVNMNANGGLGAVIQKNIMVMPDEQVDCISAVKHGNGRDWWVVGRRTTILQNGQYNNEYWVVLVDAFGVGIPSFQQIGSMNKTNLAKISFSSSGDTILFTNANDVIEYLEFDRCTGLLSNPLTIRPPATVY